MLLIMALIPAFIAKNKGKSFGTWYIYGVALWIVALIHAITLKDESNENVKQEVKREKKEIQQTSFDMPLYITGYKIVEKNNEYILHIRVKNIYTKALKAIRCDIGGKDAFKKEILIDGKKNFEITIQDIDIKAGEEIFITNNSNMPENSIRIVDIHIKEALFEDDELIKTEVIEFNDVIDVLDEDGLLIAKEKYPESYCYPQEFDKYWRCCCGYRNNTLSCKNCGCDKNEMISYFQKDTVKDRAANIRNNINAKKKKESKIMKIIMAISALIICIVIGLIIYSSNQLKNIVKGEWRISYYEDDSYVTHNDSYATLSFSEDKLYMNIYYDGECISSFDGGYRVGKNDNGEDIIYLVYTDQSEGEWMLISSYDKDFFQFQLLYGNRGYAIKQ